ncbi:MAG: flagellar biosynthesis protein FlhF [Lachnospiraceae bacterium]|nr:flagellar biosynthesis protein FlhF [Lachnospiraceae bacterium]
MLIKKFQGATEQEALQLAKQELGKDVIITHIKSIKPKGVYRLFKKPLVEITAAVDEERIYEKKTGYQHIAEEIKKNPYEFRVKEEEKSSAIEQKLDSLQSMLEKQMREQQSTNVEKEKEEPAAEEMTAAMACVQMIYNQLIANEVEEVYANKVIAEIEQSLKPDATVDNILSTIYQKIVLKLGETKELEFEEGKTKYVFFIGPTGVGKTTTIAKLASSLKLGKKAKVALFTADTYRIAAVDQLRSYATILGIPLRVIYSETEIKDAVEEYKDYDIVLIDTAGRSHKNREQRDDIEKLLLSVPEESREIYLVLSATTKYKDLVKITETYSAIAKYNLIFTKLDETAGIGNIFNIKMLTGAPLSYTTFGQSVPDDISKINPQAVAKQLLGGGQ